MSVQCKHRFCISLPLLALLSCAISSALAQDAVTLDAVEVKRQQQPYRDLTVTGATKTEALHKDLPMSVRVLGADLLQDAGVTDLAGALDLASGISRQSNLGGLWNSYSMRGFTGDPNYGSDYMVNGFNSSRGYNGLRDGANTQSVEILKGPASALYGRGEPGGTVNINTKKPLFKPEYSVDVSAASHDTYRTAFDLTGPLGQSVAYRLNAAYQDGHSYRDTVTSKHYQVSPSFIWMISPDTTLSYEIEAVRLDAPFDRGITAVNGDAEALPRERYLGEPSSGDNTVKSLGHQLFLQHFLNDDWSIQTGVSYRKSSLKGYSTEAWSLLSDGRTLRRQQRHRDYQASDLSGRFEVLGKLHTGQITHNVLFGVDGYSFSDRRNQLRARSASTPYTIDIYEPEYGVSTHGAFSVLTNNDESQKAYALYLQDQIDLSERWKALAGLRYDSFEQETQDYLAGNLVSQDQSSVSPRVGLVYHPNSLLSLYATFSEGFRPNSGISRLGSSFDPEESTSNEIGVKLDAPDGSYSGTLALYKIKKQNVLTNDPQDINYSIAVGEVESNGVELDVSGELAKNLRLSLAYAYTDAKVTKSTSSAESTGLAEGRRMPNVPYNSGNIFLMYNRPLLANRELSLGGGWFYTGERLGSVDENNDFVLDAYSTVKLLASYKPNKKTRIYLEADNVFDEEYSAYSYSSLWVYPGEGRSYKVGLQYTF
jgi:iron complex outermembrane receptor protein